MNYGLGCDCRVRTTGLYGLGGSPGMGFLLESLLLSKSGSGSKSKDDGKATKPKLTNAAYWRTQVANSERLVQKAARLRVKEEGIQAQALVANTGNALAAVSQSETSATWKRAIPWLIGGTVAAVAIYAYMRRGRK